MAKSVQRGYMLRGVLRRGVCNSAMTPASAYKGKREYRYYLHEARSRGAQCVSYAAAAGAGSRAQAPERLHHVERRLDQLQQVRAEAEWAATTLASFEKLWDKLTDENRSRLIASLIERVSVNEGTNAIRIQLVDHAKQIDHAA